jgi:hypothetical protein
MTLNTGVASLTHTLSLKPVQKNEIPCRLSLLESLNKFALTKVKSLWYWSEGCICGDDTHCLMGTTEFLVQPLKVYILLPVIFF